jgi:hypothetical protein
MLKKLLRSENSCRLKKTHTTQHILYKLIEQLMQIRYAVLLPNALLGLAGNYFNTSQELEH